MQNNKDASLGTVIDALADPVRRQVVTLLSGGTLRAGQLAEETGMSAPAMSRHLRLLLEAGVVEDERTGADARARVFRLRPQSLVVVRVWLDQLQASRNEEFRS